jgi:hypothetical protein
MSKHHPMLLPNSLSHTCLRGDANAYSLHDEICYGILDNGVFRSREFLLNLTSHYHCSSLSSMLLLPATGHISQFSYSPSQCSSRLRKGLSN